jgi:CcmD family protein
MSTITRILSLLVLAVVFGSDLFGGSSAVLARQSQPTVAAPEQGFVPVTNLPAQEQLPAAPLVMGAYAVAWVAVLLYLWSIWRRLSHVEREIASVNRRIEAGARR